MASTERERRRRGIAVSHVLAVSERWIALERLETSAEGDAHETCFEPAARCWRLKVVLDNVPVIVGSFWVVRLISL